MEHANLIEHAGPAGDATTVGRSEDTHSAPPLTEMASEQRHQEHEREMAEAQDSLPDWQQSAADWQGLADAGARVPLFMGSAWCESWLETFGAALSPSLFAHREGDALVGACLLVDRAEKRGPIPVRCTHLHTAGEPVGEGVCVEYNELLAAAGHAHAVASALKVELERRGADEFVAGGVTEATYELLAAALPRWQVEVEWSEDAWVDLAGLRASGDEYRQAVLSRNSRAQINRSMKAYEAVGEIEVEVAASVERRLELLDELIELHQATWQGRGEGGAFGAPRMREFHRRFIERDVSGDAAQLLRVSAGGEAIGVLYNFVDHGRVFFYQCGLQYREGKKFRPGLSAHVLAIEHYLAEGLDEYHFLAGDSTTPRYKQSLSNQATRLAWVNFQRPGMKARLIRGLRTLKSALQRSE